MVTWVSLKDICETPQLVTVVLNKIIKPQSVIVVLKKIVKPQFMIVVFKDIFKTTITNCDFMVIMIKNF